MNRSIEKGLSSGERQMMARAKRILASEIQYAKDLDEAEAQAYLDELLEEIALERETAASRAAEVVPPGPGRRASTGPTAGRNRDHDDRHPHGLRPDRSARGDPDRQPHGVPGFLSSVFFPLSRLGQCGARRCSSRLADRRSRRQRVRPRTPQGRDRSFQPLGLRARGRRRRPPARAGRGRPARLRRLAAALRRPLRAAAAVPGARLRVRDRRRAPGARHPAPDRHQPGAVRVAVGRARRASAPRSSSTRPRSSTAASPTSSPPASSTASS